MMTPAKTRDRSAEYTPDSDAPMRRWWRRRWSFGEILAGLGLTALLLNGLGWHYLPTAKALELEAHERAGADTLLRRDVDRNAKRTDSLSDRMLFLSYLQCVQATGRLDAKAQTECQLIIQRRLSP